MRLRFEFSLPMGKLVLPIHYNHFLQRMIYDNITADTVRYLHEQGFSSEKLQFRFFTFSRLFGDHRIICARPHQSRLEFSTTIRFFLSSPVDLLMREILSRLSPGVYLGLHSGRVSIASVTEPPPPDFHKGPLAVKMLSPITLRRSERKADGSERLHYYSPMDTEFSDRVRLNLVKKFHTLFGREPENSEFSIRPLHFSEHKNFHLVIYKEHAIKAYGGSFELDGSPELKRLAYDVGLGGRNFQGFRMFEKISSQ